MDITSKIENETNRATNQSLELRIQLISDSMLDLAAIVQVRLRGGNGDFWPKNLFFLFLINTMPDWFSKYQEARIFFLFKKKLYSCVFPNSDE